MFRKTNSKYFQIKFSMFIVFSFKWAQHVFATETFAQSFARILYAYMYDSKILVTFTIRLRENTPTKYRFCHERKKEREKERKKKRNIHVDR